MPLSPSLPVTSLNPITRVLITGTHGQLGAAMVQAFAGRTVTAHTRATLDITDAAAVNRAVDEASPQLIVNCGAFNHVDGAEDRAVEALAVNAFAVQNLVRAAENDGARLVHYSADFVFDGSANAPYTEDVRPSPRGTYACTKLLGEWFALEAPHAYVLRVEWPDGTDTAGTNPDTWVAFPLRLLEWVTNEGYTAAREALWHHPPPDPKAPPPGTP